MTTDEARAPRRWLLVAWVLATAACSAAPATDLDHTRATSATAGCELMKTKCTRCHEIDRLTVYRAPTPGHWDSLVTRMRRQRGSHITAREGRLITECLVHRDFGDAGIQTLYGDQRDNASP